MNRRFFQALIFLALALTFTVFPAIAAADVKINAILYDGAEPRKEGDEYIELINLGDMALNIGGYTITANDGQRFTFPDGTMINVGQTCRLYTNRETGAPCSFSWGSNTARWNNDGDCAKLFNSSNQVVDEFCYEHAGADATTATRPVTASTPPPASNPPENSSTENNSSGVPCPATGSWPAGCVPGGSGAASSTAPPAANNSGGVPCPATGAWPAGCVSGGNANSAPANPAPTNNSSGVPCPATGSWPAGCVPGGSSGSGATTPPPANNSSGVPCPSTGAWPAGCVPGGSSGSEATTPPPANNSGGVPCPATGAWPAGCVVTVRNANNGSGAPAGSSASSSSSSAVNSDWSEAEFEDYLRKNRNKIGELGLDIKAVIVDNYEEGISSMFFDISWNNAAWVFSTATAAEVRAYGQELLEDGLAYWGEDTAFLIVVQHTWYSDVDTWEEDGDCYYVGSYYPDSGGWYVTQDFVTAGNYPNGATQPYVDESCSDYLR